MKVTLVLAASLISLLALFDSATNSASFITGVAAQSATQSFDSENMIIR